MCFIFYLFVLLVGVVFSFEGVIYVELGKIIG